MWKRLRQKSVQGWVEICPSVLRTTIGQICDSKNGTFLSFSFVFWKISFSLQNRRIFYRKQKRKERGNFGQMFDSKKGNFWTDFDSTTYTYIYIYTVRLGSGPISALSKVRFWTTFVLDVFGQTQGVEGLLVLWANKVTKMKVRFWTKVALFWIPNWSRTKLSPWSRT